MNIHKVLLTGGSGLTGRTLAPMLKTKYDVTHFEMTDPGDGLPFVQGDLRSSQDVAAACVGMDAIVHVAALHGRAWNEAGDDVGFEVNVVGAKNILEAAAAAGVKRVLFTSSIWATGHGSPAPPSMPIDEDLDREPRELYGLTKILGEQMCRYASANSALSTIVLRPGGIRPAELYAPGEACYLFGAVDVRDVAQAHMLALEAPEEVHHDVFLATTDSPLKETDPAALQADPAAVLEAVAPGAGKLVEQGKIEVPGEAEWYTVAKGRRVLGYEPQYGFVVS